MKQNKYLYKYFWFAFSYMNMCADLNEILVLILFSLDRHLESQLNECLGGFFVWLLDNRPAGVEKTVGVVSVDYCICEKLPTGLEDVAVDDTTRFLRPLFSVGQFSL